MAAPNSSSYSPDFRDPTPKDFEEVQATHSVLMSSAYYIQEYCKDYNNDFMVCKRDNGDPAKCALEGRKVTRCVLDLFRQLNVHCDDTLEKHWRCLENNNNYYWKCRSEERELNQCVFRKMGLKKTVPDAPDYEVPIFMRSDKERWHK